MDENTDFDGKREKVEMRSSQKEAYVFHFNVKYSADYLVLFYS